VVCWSPRWLRLVRMSPTWSVGDLRRRRREHHAGLPGPLLYGEGAPAIANGAIARLRPRSARSVREPLRAAGYEEKPATYVISERDAILPANVAERVAALAQATTISLDSDHHPMLSRPAELALILAGIVARTALAEPAAS
jgi:pimeloyl-ACP methyl ester carboxylesterase